MLVHHFTSTTVLALAAFAPLLPCRVCANEASPIGKCLELLDLLKGRLAEEAEADGKGYVEFTTWYHDEVRSSKEIIQEATQTAKELQATLTEQEMFRAVKNQALEKAANKLAKDSKELGDAQAMRKQERAIFEEKESELLGALDSLGRSLVVLSKQAPGASSAAAASSASLLSVAKHLKKTIERSPDLSLTGMQRETLNSFYWLAVHKPDESLHETAPAFLQVQSETEKGYGDYSSQSGGVVTTIQGVMQKTQASLEEIRRAEGIAGPQFNQIQSALQLQIQTTENTKSELQAQLSSSEEQTGQAQSQLLAEQQRLKVSQEHLDLVEAQFLERSVRYKERVSKRSDEQMAVKEAIEILTSDAAQRLLPKDGAQPVAGPVQPASLSAPPSFAALRSKTHHGHRRSHTHLRYRSDPFAKVKTMVRGMITKLSNEAAADQKKHEYCDREMSRSTKSKHEKEDDILKVKEKIGSMDAQLAQLKTDIELITKDVAAIQKANEEAKKVREDEHEAAVTAIKQYADALKLLKTAVKVLKNFYEQKAAEKVSLGQQRQPSTPEMKYKKSGYGASIVGLLEIAIQDYDDLKIATETAEAADQRSYTEMKNENEIRLAVFGKDLEYKGRSEAKLTGDRMRANNDLKSYEKELAAVTSYLSELKAQCIAKPESYEERKQRREKELASLKEAVTFLNGQSVA